MAPNLVQTPEAGLRPTLHLPPMPPLADLRHITVWIVEDDRSFRDAFVDVVGPQVALDGIFGSVEEARARLDVLGPHGKRPDVVVLDVNLPGLDGVDGVAEIKARAPRSRIVMLTIRDDAETIGAALGAGASGYLTKDAPPEQLLAAVQAAHAGGLVMQPAVARVVRRAFEARPAPPDYGLTEREAEVLAEMARGGTQREIAERMFVSPSTVNSHLQRVYEKLHVHSGTAAVAKAIREGIVPRT